MLNDLMRNWLEQWWRPRHPGCTLNYEDMNENPPHQLLGVELDEYLRSLDEFRLSGRYEQMPPDPEVLQWFQQHGSRFRHVALTSSPRTAAPTSSHWVLRHFGNWIRTFHFVPSARRGEILPEYDTTKADALKRLNPVDIFIDDDPRNVADLTETGIRYFLLSRPWNTSTLKMEELLGTLGSVGILPMRRGAIPSASLRAGSGPACTGETPAILMGGTPMLL